MTTTFNMTCEAVEATLLDYLDGTLEAWVRQSMDEHLAECARCAALVRDFRYMEREARALPALVPERDPWPEVARGIGAPVIASGPVAQTEPSMASNEPPVLPSVVPPISEAPPPTNGEPVPVAESLPPVSKTLPPPAEAPLSTTEPAIDLLERRERRLGWAWMGLAAAALVLVTAGTTFFLTARSFGPARTVHVASDTVTGKLSSGGAPPSNRRAGGGPGNEQIRRDSSAPIPTAGSPTSSPPIATTAVRQVRRSPDEVVYDKEIDMLEGMTRRGKTDLDASTAAVIERNLRIIDANIAQIRAALQKDPGSPMLGDQVSRALDMKVELLRRVALLQSNT